MRAMTTEEIASRSGASTATIYKWWPNMYAVAVEAFLTEMMADSPDPDTGSAHEDFRLVIRGLTHFYTGGSGRVFAQLVGPMLYRLLLGHAPLDDAAADIVVDGAMRGFAV